MWLWKWNSCESRATSAKASESSISFTCCYMERKNPNKRNASKHRDAIVTCTHTYTHTFLYKFSPRIYLPARHNPQSDEDEEWSTFLSFPPIFFFCLCGPSLKAKQIEILILSCAGMLEREDRQKETVTEIIKSSASCRWCSEMRILFCSAGCVFVQLLLLLLLPLHRKTIEEMFFVLSPPPPGCGRWRWGVNSWCTRRNNASFLCLYVCLCSERE